MRVKVLFFGMLKDIAGRSNEVVDVPDGATVGDVFEHFAGSFPRLKEYKKSIVMARNQEFARPEEPVAPDDEIAFMPPVSGGAPGNEILTPEGHWFALTREPIDAGAVKQRLLRGEDGAVVAFEGVARNNTRGRRTRYLDYECYEPLALKTMQRLGGEIAAAHEIGRIGIVHRLGRIEIGETSVAIVVTAPHRQAAFAAAREAIDRLKRTVPIWKKEYFEDGEVWVEGEWDDSVLESR